MNAQEAIIQDYHGNGYFVHKDTEQDITIFVVDDNKIYLNLLKNSIKQKNHSVLAFRTGEECLEYLSLKPDLVVLDYHLDSVNHYAKNGDEIAKIIREKSPETEIILISSDEKFRFLSQLNFSKHLLFKDNLAFPKIEDNIQSVIHHTEEVEDHLSKSKIITLAILFLVVSLVVYNLYLF